MKKLLAAALVLAMVLSLAGCTLSGAGMDDLDPTTGEPTALTVPTQPEDAVLPLPQDSLELLFTSGAGAWYSSIILSPDGSFTGSYHNSDMGVYSDAYPYGTVYESSFSGKFENITQISDHSYAMTLTQVELDRPEGEEWIQDGIRYVSSDAFGLTGGEKFVFYLPETPLEGLSEDLLMWWHFRYDRENYETLSAYGIENVAKGYGFFTWN